MDFPLIVTFLKIRESGFPGNAQIYDMLEERDHGIPRNAQNSVVATFLKSRDHRGLGDAQDSTTAILVKIRDRGIFKRRTKLRYSKKPGSPNPEERTTPCSRDILENSNYGVLCAAKDSIIATCLRDYEFAGDAKTLFIKKRRAT